MSTPDVLTLQRLLVSLNLLKVTPNGYYGPATEQAVRDYQRTHNLPSVGVVGPLTLASMNALLNINNQGPITNPTPTTFTRDLTLNTQGLDVRALQIYLNTHGYPVSPTGPGSRGQETTLFGPRTRAALILFQRDNGITPTGYFGPRTRTYITGNP